MKKDFFDCNSYLNKFWPKKIISNEIWEDNFFLLNQYVNCQKIISKISKNKRKNFDISTGPILAPLIAFAPCINEIQLSDYSDTNRELLKNMDINYWYEYCKKILDIEGNKKNNKQLIIKRLEKVNNLRKKNNPVFLNILNNKVFLKKDVFKKWNLFTMHFVADSIVDSKEKYFELMNRFLSIIKINDIVVISALIECNNWTDGIGDFEAANIKTQEIIDFLRKNNFNLLYSQERKANDKAGHNGGMAVICAIKF